MEQSENIDIQLESSEIIKNIQDFINKYPYEIVLALVILGVIAYKIWSENNISFQSNKMNPKIPRVIYQCYKDKNVPPVVKERWLKLNPDFDYKFYDDNDCYQFILEYYGKDYANFFKNIKDGPIRSDFWRICILYQFGGIYADVDIEPLIPIDEIVNSDTTLYTCVTAKNLDNNLNPHFIAVEPKNPLILHCIYVYMKDRIKRPYSYLGYSITHVMFQVLQSYFNIYKFKEDIYKKDNQVVQLSQEICPIKTDINTCYIEQNNKQIMKNRDKNLYDSFKHKFK